ASETVHCALLTQKDYAPDRWVPVYQWNERVTIGSGRQRHRFSFPPILDSTHEVYRLEIQPVETGPHSLQLTNAPLHVYGADSGIELFRLKTDRALPAPLRNHTLQFVLLALYSIGIATFAFNVAVRLPER